MLSSILSANSNNNSLGYTTSVLKKYWCHICKREFSKIYIENIDIQCNYCGKTFCEELEQEPLSNTNTNNQLNNVNENHPSNFQPYEPISSSNNRNDNTFRFFLNRRVRPRTTSNLLDMILEYLAAQQYEENLEDIINQIMLNDPNKYGNPPASKDSVEKLEKCVIDKKKIKEMGNENTCAVCKDEFECGQDCLSMPCQHYFHKECIIPWLKERNSCPVCRFELPTDDEDYEKKKRNSH
jgi:E3 ubiquitin-protein ligase RNF115/126